MHSSPGPKQTDSRNVLVARADEEFANALNRPARDQERASRLEQDAARYACEPQFPMDTFRPALVRRRPALLGSLIGLLLAACVCVAAIVYYGDEAKPTIARWAQQLVPTSSQLPEKPAPAQPSPPSAQMAALEQLSPAPAPPEPAGQAQIAPLDVAPTAAQVPPVLAELLQTIMRDLANVEQEIAQLKTSQAQIARDDAIVAEQVKASQEQIARVIAKASEYDERRPKRSARRARPPTREQARTYPSPQPAAQP
jgi:hypothetical protein